MNVGSLEVIVGGMFAGKSEELIRRGKRHMFAGKKVLFVKPKIDNRYKDEMIMTHDGNFKRALVVENIEELYKHHCFDVVCIDEVQFFDKVATKNIINFLIYQCGVKVIVSGLDMDRNGEPFGVVPYLISRAEEVVKLQAVCVDCGNDAWISHGLFKGGAQIEVGAKEKYIPLCRSCDNKRRKSND